ncbi:MAG: hypothetical protein WBQ68_03665 [Terriglobales bacterium]
MAQALFLVPSVLLLAVALDRGWVLLTVPPPVIGVVGPPFLRAVQAYLAVFRVCRDFLPVIIGAALPLARKFAAYQLPGLIFRWLEGSLTVAALPFDHTAGCRT